VAIADNQNSAMAFVARLLENFILREKLTTSTMNGLNGRARCCGSVSARLLECYEPFTQYTKAAPFQARSRQCLCAFHRGWRAWAGSLARDVRGFCHQSSTPMKALTWL
jgi:catalase